MKLILVPTDFSTAAENSMQYAARLAKQINTSLVLLHIYQLPITMVDMPVLMVSAEEIKKNTDETLSQTKEQAVTRHPGLTVEAESRMGDIVDEIIDFCKEKDPFAIVVGTKGLSGLEKLLFGNTSTALIRESRYPVIAVPENLNSGTPKNIVLATDLTHVNEVPAQKIIEVVQSLKANLHIVHIQEGQESNSENKQQLLDSLNALNPSFHEVRSTDVTEGLQQYVKENNIDLLLVLPHKHNLYEKLFFKLHAESIVEKSPVPVMCLR